MSNQQHAAKFYATGKISAWNGSGRAVRVLIGRKWWTLTAALVAELS